MNPRDKAIKIYEDSSAAMKTNGDPIMPIVMGLWHVRQEAIEECYDLCCQELGAEHTIPRRLAIMKRTITF